VALEVTGSTPVIHPLWSGLFVNRKKLFYNLCKTAAKLSATNFQERVHNWNLFRHEQIPLKPRLV